MYRTIESRKREEAQKRGSVPDKLEPRLRAFAREKGGRFVLFGSLARGEARFDSDIDLIIDFPPESEGEAWRFVEEVCAELRIEADIMPLGWCEPAFIERIMRDAVIIE